MQLRDRGTAASVAPTVGSPAPYKALLAPYSTQRSVDDPVKHAMNRACAALLRLVVGNGYGEGTVVLVLDTRYWPSTRTVLDAVPGAFVYAAQHDDDEYAAMTSCMSPQSCLVPGDYGTLDELVACRYPAAAVRLDVADFCASWSSVKDCILKRLRGPLYADTAVLRLTVCARNGRATDAETISDVIRDVTEAAHEGGRNATVLPCGVWSTDDESCAAGAPTDPCALCWTYWPRMMNFFFLVLRRGAPPPPPAVADMLSLAKQLMYAAAQRTYQRQYIVDAHHAPELLLGARVAVKWKMTDGSEQWYDGEVVKHDEHFGYDVQYDDGSVHW